MTRRGTLDLDTVPNGQAATAGFELLYEHHYRDVHRYVLGMTRSRDDADDVSAEVFERAYAAVIAGRGPGERPLPWLLLTARRVVTDRWRRLRRFGDLVGTGRVRQLEPDAGEDRTEFWLWFDALARALSARQREVLLLRYQRDLTDDDIGLVMSLTPSGVRSLASRALAVLREHPELLP